MAPVLPLVILPTYQEAENIRNALTRVREVVPDAHVLVVDDGSPDGTADLAEAWAADHGGGLSVLRRSGKREQPRGASPTGRAARPRPGWAPRIEPDSPGAWNTVTTSWWRWTPMDNTTQRCCPN